MRAALPDLSAEALARLNEAINSEVFFDSFMCTAACGQIVVEEVYNAVLERSADEVGLALHKALLGNERLGSFFKSLLKSEEFESLRFVTSDNVSLAAVYTAILDRAPDPIGIERYVSALRNGMTVEALLHEFIAMREPQGAAALNTALFDICAITRKMLISSLTYKGCKIKLAPPNPSGNAKAVSALAAKILFTFQVLTV